MSLGEDEMKLFLNMCDETFSKYDLNKNDRIEFNELGKLMKDIAEEIEIDPPTYEDVANVMKKGDINKDSVISKEEFRELFKILYIMKKKLYEKS
jgi:hypothetical protein